MRPGYLLSKRSTGPRAKITTCVHVCTRYRRKLYLYFEKKKMMRSVVFYWRRFFFFLAPNVQEAAARHSQRKKKCLARWRFLEQCIESASIGGQMETPVLVYPTQVWKLQPWRAVLECATDKSPLPLQTSLQGDWLTRS